MRHRLSRYIEPVRRLLVDAPVLLGSRLWLRGGSDGLGGLRRGSDGLGGLRRGSGARGLLLSRRRLNIAAAYPLRNERLHNAVAYALHRTFSERRALHLGHRIALRNIHRARIVDERRQVLRLYLALADLFLHRVKVVLPVLVLFQGHSAVGYPAEHLVCDDVAALHHLRREFRLRVLLAVDIKAGLPVRRGELAVFVQMFPVHDEIAPAALAPREPAAAVQQGVYFEVHCRLEPHGHIHLFGGVLHYLAGHIVAVHLLRQPLLHACECVHGYLVGKALVGGDIRIIICVVEIRKDVPHYILGNIRIHKRRRGKPAGGIHLNNAEVLQPAAELPGGDAEHQVEIVPPCVCFLCAGNSAGKEKINLGFRVVLHPDKVQPLVDALVVAVLAQPHEHRFLERRAAVHEAVPQRGGPYAVAAAHIVYPAVEHDLLVDRAEVVLYVDVHSAQGVAQVGNAVDVRLSGAKRFIAYRDGVLREIGEVVVAEIQQ